MHHCWNSPFWSQISNTLIWLRFFICFTTYSPKLQTHVNSTRVLSLYCPTVKTRSVARFKKILQSLESVCVCVLEEHYYLQFPYLGLHKCYSFSFSHCLMKGRNSECFPRMGVWTTLQLINTGAERRCKFGGGDKWEFIVIRWKRA